MARRIRPQWVKGSVLVRQMGIVRWMAAKNCWLQFGEIARGTVGNDLSSRRQLHRDLIALQRAGLPVEWSGYREWRVKRSALLAWVKSVE